MAFTEWTPFTAAASVAGAGTVPWGTPGNALVDSPDSATASLSSSPNHVSQRLVLTDADFSALADTDFIEGIEVRVRRRQGGGTVRDNSLTLWAGGAEIGEDKGRLSTNWPDSAGTAVYGGTADQWGLALTGADVRGPGFGIQLRAERQGGTPTAFVEFPEIRLSYTSGVQITKGVALAVQGARGAANVSKALALALQGPGATSGDRALLAKCNVLVIEGPGATSADEVEIKKAVLYVIATGNTGEIDEEVSFEVVAEMAGDELSEIDEEVSFEVVADIVVDETTRTPVLCEQIVPGCIEDDVTLKGRVC